MLAGLLLVAAQAMTPPPADPELDHQLAALHIRAGAPADLRQRDQALAWLLAHGERVLPAALARAEAAPDDLVLLDLLGRLRRPEATPLLLRAFGHERSRAVAAAGLGASPDPAARQALRDALASAKAGDAVAALGGLGASADSAVCADVIARLDAADAELRWVAVDVGSRLGCVERVVLQKIARDDADAAVRALAAERLAASR